MSKGGTESRILAWLLRGRGIQSRLMTRKCRGCDNTSFHTAHLTRYGHWLTAR